jgi:hypothetical protein
MGHDQLEFAKPGLACGSIHGYGAEGDLLSESWK